MYVLHKILLMKYLLFLYILFLCLLIVLCTVEQVLNLNVILGRGVPDLATDSPFDVGAVDEQLDSCMMIHF